jgi:hypothetical protein
MFPTVISDVPDSYFRSEGIVYNAQLAGAALLEKFFYNAHLAGKVPVLTYRICGDTLTTLYSYPSVQV